MIEVRCPGTMHARLDPEKGIFEIKCKRRGCGAAHGVVVLHVFSIHTGELVDTRQFRDPSSLRKEAEHGPRQSAASVRAA